MALSGGVLGAGRWAWRLSRPLICALGFRRPRLSIVVPIYNVEDYLEECLVSILGQRFQDFEVILVDDGSTDRSSRIARRYARRHVRIRLVQQRNAGLGAARNVGVQACRGHLLAFVDSDDVLPPDAYSAMVGTLHQTGSDFVVGMLKRESDGGLFATRLMRENHRDPRLRTTIDEWPLLLADVFAVNKVFQRSFWDDAQLAFPEGLRYEDQVALTKAFLTARAVDVITDTVYVWRVRGDKSSITQRRHELQDLNDRIATKRLSTEMVLAHGNPELQRVWFESVLPVDMWEYFRAVPGCTGEYWNEIRNAVTDFWGVGQPVAFEDTRLPVQQRLMGWFVLQDRRSDLERLIRFLDERQGSLPIVARGNKQMCLLPGHDETASGIPESLFLLADHERPRTRCPDRR